MKTYPNLIIIFSINELLKIKDDLTKERDEKLQEITKVQECIKILYFIKNYLTLLKISLLLSSFISFSSIS